MQGLAGRKDSGPWMVHGLLPRASNENQPTNQADALYWTKNTYLWAEPKDTASSLQLLLEYYMVPYLLICQQVCVMLLIFVKTAPPAQGDLQLIPI